MYFGVILRVKVVTAPTTVLPDASETVTVVVIKLDNAPVK